MFQNYLTNLTNLCRNVYTFVGMSTITSFHLMTSKLTKKCETGSLTLNFVKSLIIAENKLYFLCEMSTGKHFK